jgi:hypothetical protein
MLRDERQLEVSFTRAMLEVYESARRLKPPYNPIAFRQMVAEHGGRETANRLLAGRTPSSGFGELFSRGKENLKLSVEYLVLQSPWNTLFRPEQLAEARRRLIEVGCELPPDTEDKPSADWPLPEELPANSEITEGAARSVVVNAYERSPEARAKCIAHHGTSCAVCGFDFGQAYGATAKGFIHVHHIVPLSMIKQSYTVDPVNDLRPVCPNCHAVIHLGGGCRSIEEVKALRLGAGRA